MGPDDSSSATIRLMGNSHIPPRCPLSMCQHTQILFLYPQKDPRDLCVLCPSKYPTKQWKAKRSPSCSHSSSLVVTFHFLLHGRAALFFLSTKLKRLQIQIKYTTVMFTRFLIQKCFLPCSSLKVS